MYVDQSVYILELWSNTIFQEIWRLAHTSIQFLLFFVSESLNWSENLSSSSHSSIYNIFLCSFSWAACKSFSFSCFNCYWYTRGRIPNCFCLETLNSLGLTPWVFINFASILMILKILLTFDLASSISGATYLVSRAISTEATPLSLNTWISDPKSLEFDRLYLSCPSYGVWSILLSKGKPSSKKVSSGVILIKFGFGDYLSCAFGVYIVYLLLTFIFWFSSGPSRNDYFDTRWFVFIYGFWFFTVFDSGSY